MEKWTVEQYHEYLAKQANAKTKFNNKKVIYKGIKFDSIVERNRYIILKDDIKHGKIKNLIVHPKFKLLDKVKWQGQTLRSRSYIADFQYQKGNNIIVEDVKSVITQKDKAFRLKMRLFIQKYPQYVFKIITY